MSEPTPPPPPSAPPPSGSTPPPPGPPGGAGDGAAGGGHVSDNRTIMVVLSYLGILALIPLLVEKEDQEVQWHAKHGLVLFGFYFVVSIALGILSMIPGLGCVTVLLYFPLILAAIVTAVLGIMKGINGDRLRLPVLSDLPDQF